MIRIELHEWNYISQFLLYFFKAYLPFLEGTEANNQNAACNLHRQNSVSILHWGGNISSTFLQLSWGQIGTCQDCGLSSSKTAKRVLELSKSDHVGLRYLKVDVVMGVKLAKKSGKKVAKKVAKGWQGGNDNQVGHWRVLASYKQHDPSSDFLSFCTFLAKYKKNERKKTRLNWHRGFMLPFSQFGLHLQTDFWTLSILFWSTTTILWPQSLKRLFDRLIEHFLKKWQEKNCCCLC